MIILLRYSLILLVLLSSFIVATDSADARRRFRLGGGSRTVVVPVVRPGSRDSSSPESASSGDSGPPITLVHSLPDTDDFAYANGYYDIGFRDTSDGNGEYVIFSGTYASPLKPPLQKGLADIIGFDPVERHKAGRKTTAVTPFARQGAVTPAATSRGLPWFSILIVLALAGAGLLFLWKRLTSQAKEVSVDANMPGMEARIDARLRQLRTSR